MPKLTAARLRELLECDPESGTFTWRPRSAGSNGGLKYVQIEIDGRTYHRHHLIWFYVHGEWPQTKLDHRDCNPKNDGIANLRPATSSQNAANARRRKDNTSGFKGVYFDTQKRKWTARITKDGVSYYLGKFSTPDVAHQAYCAAAEKLHGEFARFA
jgi:hypothetical protein